ncbi:MAG TPA: PEP-CTERM sorting domain-containing protein [Bryobacteraceae bacterium]|nr:PEP-CTERM sorting domain-containing protein [Bryobacteraceae bacterium]
MTKLSNVMKDRLAQASTQAMRHLSSLSVCFLCVCAWVLPGTCTATDLYVGNFFGPGNEDVLRYNGSTGASLGTFVPTGSGGLTFPLGGAFGPDGNLYVSNSDAEAVLRYNGSTGAFMNTFASSVDDAAGMKFGPDQNLYVANSASPGGVTKINGTTGAVIGPLTGGALSNPEGVVFGPDQNLYVANGDLNSVLRFNATTGNFIDTFVSSGSGGLTSARGVAFGPDGDLYVTSFGTGEVLRYDGATGTFLNAFVSAGSGGLSLPRDLVFGPDSNLYVGSFGTGSILRYNGTTGAFMDAFVPAGSGGLGGPTFLVFHDAASNAVPEPSTLGIIGLGLVGVGAWKWKATSRK